MTSGELKQLQSDLNGVHVRVRELTNTFLNIIGRDRDEVTISKMLAFLLNPRNTTIQILQGILTKIGKPELADRITADDYLDEKVTEVALENGRVDLWFKFTNCWIVIENKIDSAENGANGTQTDNYVKEIDKMAEKEQVPVAYVYLKPRYNGSIPTNDKFKSGQLTYDDLVAICKQCSVDDFRDKGNSFFMNDFMKHAEGYLMTDKELALGEEIEFYVKNGDKIAGIESNYKKQCDIVREMLADRLKDNVFGFETYRQGFYIQLFKSDWPNKSYNGVHFELRFKRKGQLSPDIIGEKITVEFRLDVEPGAVEYKNDNGLDGIAKKVKRSETYNFSSADKIENSISRIVETCREIVNQYASDIDGIVERRRKNKSMR